MNTTSIRIETFVSGKSVKSKLIINEEVIIDNILWVELAHLAKTVCIKGHFREIKEYQDVFIGELSNTHLELLDYKVRKEVLGKRIERLEIKEREINRVIEELGKWMKDREGI